MTRHGMAMLMLAGGFQSFLFAQQYPQQQYPRQQYPAQNSPYQGDPNYDGRNGNGQYDNGQYDSGQYDNGQYAGDPGYGAYDENAGYADGSQGVYAPAPPPVPSYAYQRPPMPGAGFYWVDGYWNFVGGRYSWMGGRWMRPPYAGGYWVAPRYSGGRFFIGSWGGGRQRFARGFAGSQYRYQNQYRYQRGFQPQQRSFQTPRGAYRAPSQRRSEFPGGDNRRTRPGDGGPRGGRR